MTREVVWGSATWGQPGHNVHADPFGSFVDDRHDDGPADQ